MGQVYVCGAKVGSDCRRGRTHFGSFLEYPDGDKCRGKEIERWHKALRL